LLRLMPRWTQAFDEGWFFAASDGKAVLGAIPSRASRWVWPHDNLIEVRFRAAGDAAVLRMPAWKGARWWMLVAGPKEALAAEAAGPKESPVRRLLLADVYQSLDKIANDYITDWPGAKGTFQGLFPFDYGDINPTGHWRGQTKAAIQNAGKPGDIGTLTLAQVILDPDIYGSYWNYWSPENPNFFTDFNARGIALVTTLKEHPRFKELCALAEAKVREDLHHSVTLPGGAGQECPGYQAHAIGMLEQAAAICKAHLGFDPASWGYFDASRSFFWKISQPDGGTRRILPIGDTHPGKDGPRPIDTYGVKPGNASALVSEELPGFGAILRNRPGTPRETYVAFKSGPNRGHYHGDQLAIHYGANAAPLAVDHHCSYKPRAGQEHMHNRVAFHTEKLPYANMDGFERLIAFKGGADCDIAVGQVESNRLRITAEFPPEEWDVETPEERFEATPLRYRRTVVVVKNGPGEDYLVLRDQFDGPPVGATWCLHVRSETIAQNGPRIDFGNLQVFCAAPAGFTFKSFPWSHDNGGREATQGARLTAPAGAKEFVTVLYPGSKPPPMEAVPGGVRVGVDEIVFAGGIDAAATDAVVGVKRGGKPIAALSGKEIDPDRSQGKIGLFVPDAGYPFGEIPEWLIRQRAAPPAK